MAAAFWAALVTVTVVPLVRLLLGGRAALIPGPRAASLVTYVGLVMLLGMSVPSDPANSTAAGLNPEQLQVGLAAGSLMFLLASVLVMLSGWLKLGNVFKMIATPVTAGIGNGNGTALSLAWLAIQQLTHGAMALTGPGWEWMSFMRGPCCHHTA